MGKKKAKGRGLLGKLVGLLVLAALLGAGWVYMDYQGFLKEPVTIEERTLVVSPGMGADAIVEMLAEEDLVDSPNYLRFYLWRSEKGSRLRAGVYRIPKGESVTQIVDRLLEGGESEDITVTVTEGTNLFELAAQLHRAGLADAKMFLRRARDPRYAAELGVPAGTLEGYLFPDTYRFAQGEDVDAIIARMHGRFREVWTELAARDAERLRTLSTRYELGEHEIITLASVVEKEAVLDTERPVIARVFFNRLDKGMKLQSDPTCVYPPRELGEKPSPKRCRDPESVYSTYVIKGLPPGPIGAPGRASLSAVLRPYRGAHAEGYLFFVARNDGSWGHYFSRGYKEHEQAIDYFLRKKRSRPPSLTEQP